jgi:hypothetical protein
MDETAVARATGAAQVFDLHALKANPRALKESRDG